MKTLRGIFAVVLFLGLAAFAAAQEQKPAAKFEPMDVFQLEYAADPQMAPDGSSVVYARTSMDILGDRRRSNLWLANVDGSDHRPITSGARSDFSPLVPRRQETPLRLHGRRLRAALPALDGHRANRPPHSTPPLPLGVDLVAGRKMDCLHDVYPA